MMGERDFEKELLLVPPLVPPSEWEINNLREVETLKKGGFGVIVLYEHKVTKKLVVVKKAQSDKDKFFAREIDFIVSDIMGNVAIRNHPNIVHIYGKVIETTLPHRKDKLPRVVGEGVPCLVMEAALYGSLERVVDLALKSGRQIPEKDICWFGLHIAEGLRVLHAENKVHRDIKTDNVLIRGDYSLCIADFGLSWRAKDGESKILFAQLGGTPYYFPPESLLWNIYSSRTDMWSFGVLLYRLANLNMPFESKDIGQVCAFIIGKKPNKFRNHYSPELEDVINSLLSKTPEERPTAEDMCAFFAKRVEALSCGGYTARKQTLTQTQTQTQASTCTQTQAQREDAQFGADTALSVLPSLSSSPSSDGHVSYDDDSTSSSIIYHLPSSSPYALTSASSDTFTFAPACHTSTTPFSSPSSFLYSSTSPSTSHSAPPPFELESLKNLQPFFG